MTPEIEKAKSEYTAAAKAANDVSSGQYEIENVLKQKLTDAYNYNQDIVKPLDEATASYMTAPSEARVKYEGIFNPFQREDLVSKYTQNQAIPMLTLSNILGLRQGSIADQLNAGIGGYQAKVAQSQGAAQLAQQNYDNLLNEYKVANSGSGGSGSLLSSLFSGLDLQGEAPKKGTLSPQGEWVFNGADWQPVAGGNFKPTEAKPASAGLNTESLKAKLALGVLTGDISASEAKYVGEALGGTTAQQEKEASMSSLSERLLGLSDKLDKVSKADIIKYKTKGLTGFGNYQEASDFITARDLIGMEVTRLNEKGVLTDQDRNFYLGMFPTNSDILANPKAAKSKLDSIIKYFNEKMGTTGGAGGSGSSKPSLEEIFGY